MGVYFHWADYAVFSGMLAISASIGIYHWRKSMRKVDSASGENYNLGGRNMSLLPVALSINASFISAVSILGKPSELYFYGVPFAYIILGYAFGCFINAMVFLPIIHPLKLTSGYEYLELRFNSAVGRAATISYIFMTILYLGTALYAPSVAFSQVTGMSLLISILGTGVVCTLYTAIGGIKAVVWTDAFQSAVILVGLVVLAAKGAVDAGGVNASWTIAQNEGRLKFDSFSFDLSERTTFWTQSIGGSVWLLCTNASNQTLLQRYMCLKDTKTAVKASILSNVLSSLYTVLLVAVGVAMEAHFQGCDPLTDGKVSAKDQVTALYMMHVLGPYPGLAGLFTACTFSGALSTVSSGINSLGVVVVHDLMKPAMVARKRVLCSTTWNRISLGLVVLLGLFAVGVAFTAQYLGDTVYALAMSVIGIVGGPVFGVFALALLPFVNSCGALAGLISSLIINLWLGMGAILNRNPRNRLPLRTDMCISHINGSMEYISTTAATVTVETFSNTILPDFEENPLQSYYNLSFMWYGVQALLCSLVVGICVSCVTGRNKKYPVDPSLWNPFRKRTLHVKEVEQVMEVTPVGSAATAMSPSIGQGQALPLGAGQ